MEGFVEEGLLARVASKSEDGVSRAGCAIGALNNNILPKEALTTSRATIIEEELEPSCRDKPVRGYLIAVALACVVPNSSSFSRALHRLFKIAIKSLFVVSKPFELRQLALSAMMRI
jgi:hypothetical protein